MKIQLGWRCRIHNRKFSPLNKIYSNSILSISNYYVSHLKINASRFVTWINFPHFPFQFLNLQDLFQIRSVCTTFRDYIDDELTVLKEINLAGYDERVIEPFKVLARLCENLEELNFARCNWITDELLLPMIETNAKTITSINLCGCDNLTIKSLQPIIIASKNLKKLNLAKCKWLTIGTLEAFVFHHTHVEELDLSECDIITERCLNILLQKFRNLKTLCLASVSCVNDSCLFMISKFQTNIKQLNLFKCAAITDRGIGALSLNCNQLEVLSVRGCSQVTDRSLHLMRAKNIHVDVARNRSQNPIGELVYRFSDLNNRQQMFYLQV